MKELRIDLIINDVVIFVIDRLKRFLDIVDILNEDEEINEYDEECLFCKGNEVYVIDVLFEIDSEEGWFVKFVYNKFFIIDDMVRDVYGVYEVMIESDKYNCSFYNMS